MPRSNAAGPSTGGRGLQQPPEMAPDNPSPEELTLYTTLSAYADALDALPLDLTRSFSDLRELDAVLGAHLSSLTNRLTHLAALIESPEVSPGDRIVALKEVAEEARSYKMGGEDKIRVALNTAETIITHTTYIDSLLANLATVPSLVPLLNPPKQFHIAGHLSDGTPLAPGSGPGGNNPANLSALTEIITPNTKKKRPLGAGPPGVSIAGASLASMSGINNASDKIRAPESVAAVTAAAPVVKKRKAPVQAAHIKSRVQPASSQSAPHAASQTHITEADDHDMVKKTNNSKRKGAREEEVGNNFRGDDSARTRNARAKGTYRGNGSDEDEEDSEGESATGNRPARVSRAPRPNQNTGDVDTNAAIPPLLGEDTDERRYCFCNNVSYGDMIGCDDDDCEREWFHLGCVGLLKPPQGTWYCDDCATKRSSRMPKSKKTKLAKTSGAHGGGVLETKTRVLSSNKR